MGRPDHRLDRLAVQHAAEEEAQPRTFLERPRPLAVLLPEGGSLPASKRWLDRYYAAGTVREKKPGVFCHLRSLGAWFVSVDDAPLSVLDGMTQTATLCGGFAEDPVVRRYVDGGFGDTLRFAGCTRDALAASERFATLIRAASGLPEVTYANSGAEACEKALALCRHNVPDPSKQRRVLAFEGSFHGRTLLALHASFNPKKRVPFEMAGCEVAFAPFPVWPVPNGAPPKPAAEWLAAVARADFEAARSSTADALLALELSCLEQVHTELSKGEFFAVIIEPMQSEGGDRYATPRFHQALRLLTRRHRVPLVYDEVQTGFGLGGTFCWHHRFDLVDADGQPDQPDAVTFAKRAQLGIVASCFVDPEPTFVHAASLVRGAIHAEMMVEDERGKEIEAVVRQRLEALAADFPELVEAPRNAGYALAFDLPSTEHLMRFLAQRFWRGAIVFGAGSRTVRHRLSTAYGERELDQLFAATRRTLEWLVDHPGDQPPAWQDPPAPARPEAFTDEVRVRRVDPDEQAALRQTILDLEACVYEPARREPVDRVDLAFDDPAGVVLVAERRVGGEWRPVGSALGVPLEGVATVPGPDRDSMLGRHNTLYSVAITVAPDARGLGLGRRLKRAQLAAAAEMRNDEGERRYLHASGRNRVGQTDAMMRINRSLGAYDVCVLDGAYGEQDAQALYYRMPVGAPVPAPNATGSTLPPEGVDFESGLARLFGSAPQSLAHAEESGALFGPAVNKVTICNYLTPTVVRAVEWVSALAPELEHLYLTSSRDETFDKAVRTLRYHRKSSQVVLGLEGGYVGHTTAAARSLSDPGVHRQGRGYFEAWSRVPHPAVVGTSATLAAIGEAVGTAGGPDAVIGLFLEPVQERTGRVLPADFLGELDALRRRLDVPIVTVETAAAAYRSGRGPFHTDTVAFVPDVLTWWAGGQVGFVHLGERYFVEAPLTMVSTWDGDELSLARLHHQLRAARTIDIVGSSARLDAALAPVEGAGIEVRGAGLYRVLDLGHRAAEVDDALRAQGFRSALYPNGCLALAPPLDVDPRVLTRFAEAVVEACP